MKIGLIQSSLNPDSKTAIVMEACVMYLAEQGVVYDSIDLREYDIPMCDGSALADYHSPDLLPLYDRLEDCTHYIIGMPVYQYSFSGVLKNFLDLCGGAMKNKAFGVVENSGSVRAYLAPTGLVDSLFFEFASIPVPPVVHSWAGDFSDGKLTNDHVHEKIVALVNNLKRVII